MSTDDEDIIIRREFRRRGRRGTVQLLTDIQTRLTRPCGWAPTLAAIVWRAERLGLRVEWKRGSAQ